MLDKKGNLKQGTETERENNEKEETEKITRWDGPPWSCLIIPLLGN
jgi:hypothetical protein